MNQGDTRRGGESIIKHICEHRNRPTTEKSNTRNERVGDEVGAVTIPSSDSHRPNSCSWLELSSFSPP
jgi:hypothetical protein